MAMNTNNSGPGLYDPAFEHDSCGVAFVVDILGCRSRRIVEYALTALNNLTHRGARGSEVNTGDGAGLLVNMPDKFFRKVCPRLALQVRIRSRSIGDGERSPFTIPTTTGKNDR